MVGVARTAAEQISGLLKQIQEKVVQGQNPDADTTKLNADITALSDTITSIANSAQYNGINLVGASGASKTVTVSIMRDAFRRADDRHRGADRGDAERPSPHRSRRPRRRTRSTA